MTTYDSQLLGHITEEQMKQIAEAAAKAGITEEEAVAVFTEKLPAIMKAVTMTVKAIADAIREAGEALRRLAEQFAISEEDLKAVATPKEWHLMNNAKKARTRKKYRNRLIGRLREQEGGRRGVHTT